MKTSSALTLKLWLRVQPRIPRWPYLVLSTEHTPFPMECMHLGCIFFVAILKGDLWWSRDTECMSGHEWEQQRVCVAVYDQDSVFAGVQCKVQMVKSGDAWCSLRASWNSPMQPLDSPSVITEFTGSSRLLGMGSSGLDYRHCWW
jgi:hypothetical protein